MVSNQNTYGDYYLPDFSDEYSESSFFWQVSDENALTVSSPEIWKVPEDWFPGVNDTSDQFNFADTQDMMKYYHPCLPPISVAFSLPSVLTSQDTPRTIETLHNYFPTQSDEIESSKLAQYDKLNIDNKSNNKEIKPSDMKDSSYDDWNDEPLVIGEQTIRNEKLEEHVLDSCNMIPIIHQYRTIGDGITHKLKRRKTVRELLLDKQYHMSMQKVELCSIENNTSDSVAKQNEDQHQVKRSLLVSVLKKDPVVYSKSSNPLSQVKKGDVPNLRIGRVDAKEHRPRHYDIEELHIGKYIVKNDTSSRKKMLNRLKVLFSKRRFVYEFDVHLDGENKLACIIVPFRIVSAINCSGSLVVLKVDSQPLIFLGSRQQGVGIIAATNVYDKTQSVDITKGEIKHCPFHKLILRKYQADKMKLYLWHFDGRFKVLTQLAFSEDNSGITTLLPPPDVGNVGPKKNKRGSNQPFVDETGDPEAAALSTAVVCACRTSCRSSKCSCVKAARRCNAGRSVCLCSNCGNPLNILDSIGIDSTNASLDRCLLQNIYQLSDLQRYLMQKIQLKCCKYISTLNYCIPGTVQCPNSNCHAKVQYSWCRGIATDENRLPRNHCRCCGKCHFFDVRNCMECKKCYSVKSTKGSCPNCNADVFPA